MKRLVFIGLILVLAAVVALPLLLSAKSDALPRSTPAEQGIETQALISTLDSILEQRGCDLHHMMVIRHGKVVAEVHPAPFRAEDSHSIYSLSKMLTMMAVGIAIDENRLRLDDRVMTFFHDKMPPTISSPMASITVRDLLMMASGIDNDEKLREKNTDWAKAWLAQQCDYEPGTHFHYDSMCSFMLSAIVQRVTGRTMLKYLNEKLFTPMHITDVEWEMSPDSICTGGWGARTTCEVLGKLGVLILNKGRWEGKQLMNEQYLEEACSPLITNNNYADSTDEETNILQNYGYHMWRMTWGDSLDVIVEIGRFGQMVMMMPQHDLVVVVLGVFVTNENVVRYICDQLVAGLQDAPLKSDAELQRRLEEMCANATIEFPKGAEKGNAPFGKRLVMEENGYKLQWAQIDADTLKLALSGSPVESFPMGYNRWLYGPVKGLPPYEMNALNRMQHLTHDFVAAAAYAWPSPSMLEVRVHYVNWFSASTYIFDFEKNEVRLRDDFPGNEPYKIHFEVK